MYATTVFSYPTIPNSCGNSVYKVSDEQLLKRFLMLGSENGSYYIGSHELTIEHLDCLERLLGKDPDTVLETCKSHLSKVYKKDYLLFVLARCCAAKQNPELRKESYKIALDACTIPTNLFMFVDMYEKIHKKLNGSTGWNSLMKGFVASWYLEKDVMRLAYLITKYKNRNNWTHKDVIRLSHPKGFAESFADHDALFAYITKDHDAFSGKVNDMELKAYIDDCETLKGSKDATQAVSLIEKHGFVREHVPTTLLNDVHVWNALLQKMPMVALLRNLNKLTSIGVFGLFHESLKNTISLLCNEDAIKKSKIHPLQALVALKTYSSGQGFKGSLTWKPDPLITAALNQTYKLAFNNVTPTKKRYLLALDVSGSMTGATVCGINTMTAAEVSTAMAMVIASTEPVCDVMGFSHEFKRLDVSAELPLETNMRQIYNMAFGATDISLPFEWAQQNNNAYDVFIVFTDSETNCNRIPPAQALKNYRARMGIDAKLIVVAMSANKFTVADPNDLGMMDIAGFDAETPGVIADFVLGSI